MLLHRGLPLEGGLWRPEYPHKTGARLEKQQELLGGLTLGWNIFVKQQPCEAQPEPQQLGAGISHPKALLCLTSLQHGPVSVAHPLLFVHQLVPEMRPEAPGPMFTSAAKHAPCEALCVLGSGCPSGASLTAAAEHETSQSHTLLWPAEEIKALWYI